MGRPAETGHGRTPVERFLQVGRTRLTEACRKSLAAQRPVGGEAERRLAFREAALLILGQVEEAARSRGGGGDELLRDAVPDDGEEADLVARAADLLHDARAIGADVDDRDRQGTE